MEDTQISAMNAAAWTLWVLAAACVIAALVVSLAVGFVGVLLGAGAATLHVRSGLCCLAERERNAFEIGRDTGRLLGERGERPVRQVQ